MMGTAFRWLVLLSIIVLTISGNVLMCLAVVLCRRLRRIANSFVVSLAMTDLLLGLLVLPLSATLELRSGHWPLGGTLCNLYISLDVMLCTASILTLLAISVDRYLAISAPLSYPRRVTAPRVTLAIATIWVTSLVIAFVPIHMGWNTADFRVQNQNWGIWDEVEEGRTCRFGWLNNYVLLDAFCTFYLPLTVMCLVYHCIFRIARKQVQRIRATTPSFARAPSSAVTAQGHKAIVTLAAVLGAFVICWFPYFTFYICMGIKAEKNPSNTAHSVVLWLGYLNSAINPVLYPALNSDFRRAYGEMLCGRGLCCRLQSTTIYVSQQKQMLLSNKQRHSHLINSRIDTLSTECELERKRLTLQETNDSSIMEKNK